MDKDIFAKIDYLFETAPQEAEAYMLGTLEEAKKEQDTDISLKLYNELIGYYRQTSEKDKLLGVFGNVEKLLEDMKAQGTLDYATTMLNIANGYRSIGELELAKEYYERTEKIYAAAIADNRLSANDMCIAGLFNNQSLLYQEFSDYQKAEELLLAALNIVEERGERFEIAVTYANLANTLLLSKNYDVAYAYAKEAITRFKARNFKDPHYCAALSAMATCYYEWGKVNMAKTLFTEAMEIVEKTIGRNSQYERLRESVLMCESSSKYSQTFTGMELSKKYFEEYGLPMIQAEFADYADTMTVGLVGEGSDCYGFDDAVSADHDFGPGFCIWLDDDVYEKIGERLQEAYLKLPQEYLGYKRFETAMGQGRRGVIKTSDFYIKHLGTDIYEEVDFAQVDEYELAVCTNGHIFMGEHSRFLDMRERLLKGYPQQVRLVKLASDVALFSQTGQYNFMRMAEREDDFTSQLMLNEFCVNAMKLYHHFVNVYAPHDKWLKKSTMRLEGGDALIGLLEKVTSMYRIGEQINDVATAAEEVGAFLSALMYDTGDISDTDSYLGHHTGELMFKAGIVDCDKEELVKKIAKLEFAAFDKVKNEGGRASCQNDWPVFSIMRESQYLTWNKQMLLQYMYDFTREYEQGHNLITEKYGRMMESTAPEKYEELKAYFPEISEQKKAVIEQIVAVQMSMTDEFGEEYPGLANNARSFHTSEDNYNNTSYETYLRGEISTYSDKMLQLYAGYVLECVKNNINIAKETIANTARLYGYDSIEAFEKSAEASMYM